MKTSSESCVEGGALDWFLKKNTNPLTQEYLLALAGLAQAKEQRWAEQCAEIYKLLELQKQEYEMLKCQLLQQQQECEMLARFKEGATSGVGQGLFGMGQETVDMASDLSKIRNLNMGLATILAKVGLPIKYFGELVFGESATPVRIDRILVGLGDYIDPRAHILVTLHEESRAESGLYASDPIRKRVWHSWNATGLVVEILKGDGDMVAGNEAIFRYVKMEATGN